MVVVNGASLLRSFHVLGVGFEDTGFRAALPSYLLNPDTRAAVPCRCPKAGVCYACPDSVANVRISHQVAHNEQDPARRRTGKDTRVRDACRQGPADKGTAAVRTTLGVHGGALGCKGAWDPGGEVGDGVECWRVAGDRPPGLGVVAGSVNTPGQGGMVLGLPGRGQTSPGLSPCCATD